MLRNYVFCRKILAKIEKKKFTKKVVQKVPQLSPSHAYQNQVSHVCGNPWSEALSPPWTSDSDLSRLCTSLACSKMGFSCKN